MAALLTVLLTQPKASAPPFKQRGCLGSRTGILYNPTIFAPARSLALDRTIGKAMFAMKLVNVQSPAFAVPSVNGV